MIFGEMCCCAYRFSCFLIFGSIISGVLVLDLFCCWVLFGWILQSKLYCVNMLFSFNKERVKVNYLENRKKYIFF